MTSIKETVEMLRKVEKDFGGLRPSIVVLTSDAAALIERLAGALENCANDLEAFHRSCHCTTPPTRFEIAHLEAARRALSGEPTP